MDDAKLLGLQKLDIDSLSNFESPVKKINEPADVNFFLTSRAYTDIVTFLLQLNASVFPRKTADSTQTWKLGSTAVSTTATTDQLATLLAELATYIDRAPPDQGPRRFGNIAFRKWYELAESNVDSLFEKHLPPLEVGSDQGANKELKAYLLGSFGSAQRLDYGTGHELSFLAFLASLWKLGGAKSEGDNEGVQERAIVIHVMEPYLNLVRRLIKTYTLEPAGTHGVWGLDDHSFLPYVFGSAQLGPPITHVTEIPQEGSLSGAPDPGDVVKASTVEREREVNMYFAAIGFIYDVKKGPFWEHSPMLYDISGIRTGWAKINKGMIKMYIAEVLSKFPVVQHFPFGQLFKWERDPHATSKVNPPQPSTVRGPSVPSTSAPGISTARGGPAASPPTRDAWTMQSKDPSINAPGAPGASSDMPPTRAPWAKVVETHQPQTGPMPSTRAPWAKDR